MSHTYMSCRLRYPVYIEKEEIIKEIMTPITVTQVTSEIMSPPVTSVQEFLYHSNSAGFFFSYITIMASWRSTDETEPMDTSDNLCCWFYQAECGIWNRMEVLYYFITIPKFFLTYFPKAHFPL